MKDEIYVGALISEEHLKHHGILGMHWGVRRFQREDGSLTSAGKKRKLANEHKNEGEKAKKSVFSKENKAKFKKAIDRAAQKLEDQASDDFVFGNKKMVNEKHVVAAALRSLSKRNTSDLRDTIDSYDFFNDTKYGDKFDNLMSYVDMLKRK